MIKRVLFGSFLFILIFIGAALSFNFIQNRNRDTRPVEGYNPTMGKAYILCDGQQINGMQGYKYSINTSLYRDSIFTVDSEKNVNILLPDSIDNGADIKYELRSFDGVNLVEDGDFRFVSTDDGMTQYTASLRMDMTVGTEYSFVIKVEKSREDIIRYYTRVVRLESSRLGDFVTYAKNFSDAVFAGNTEYQSMASMTDAIEEEAAGLPMATSTDAMAGVRVPDITNVFGSADALSSMYNAEKADDVTSDGNPGYVTLNSSYEDVIYDGMKIQRISDPIPKVREITPDSVVMELIYKVITETDNGADTFAISEYFTMDYNNGAAKIEVTDYRRRMDQDFTGEGFDVVSNSVSLGITSDRNPQFMASEDSKIVSCVADNSIWVYNNKSGTYSNVYGTSSEEALEERIPQEGYDIRLLCLKDEVIDFVIFGRINEGPREGQNGIALFEYSVQDANLKELAFIRSDLNLDAMELSVGRFCYFDKKNRHFYTLVGDNLLDVDIFSGQKETMVSDIPASQFMISEDMNIIAYPDKADQTDVQCINVVNFDNGKKIEKKESGHKMAPLGFVGEDFLYGVSEPEYVSRDADGTPRFLFDKLYIIRNDGSIVKKYEVENVLVSGITFEENTIYLKRIAVDPEAGTAAAASDDYISYKPQAEVGGIRVRVIKNDKDNDEVQLKFPDNVFLNRSNEELFTKVSFNSNAVELRDEESQIDKSAIYIYSPLGISGSSYSVGKAIGQVYEDGGFVVDSSGSTLYREKASRPYLTVAGTFEYKAVDNPDDSFAACNYMCTLAAKLPANYDEVRNSASWEDSFLKYGNDYKGINISGVKLDTAVGYLSDGYPFAAKIDDRYVLVVSYNDDFIRYYDPVEDEEVRIQRYSFQLKCEDKGNEFYTFYR